MNSYHLDKSYQYIKNLNLSYIVASLSRKIDCSSDEGFQYVERYKNFLRLRLKYWPKILSPTLDIDLVWHSHILHTEFYTNDCKKIFGDYLHHVPEPLFEIESDIVREIQKEMDIVTMQTAILYELEFNEPYFVDKTILLQKNLFHLFK